MTRGRPPVCIHCGSSRSVRKGLRRTKQLGLRQIRMCKDCQRKFTPRHQGPRGPAEPQGAEGIARAKLQSVSPEPQPQTAAVEAATPDEQLS